MSTTAAEFALRAAKAISDGWGEKEEQKAAEQLLPLFQQWDEHCSKEWERMYSYLKADNTKLASEVNTMARALTVALRYYRGPLE